MGTKKQLRTNKLRKKKQRKTSKVLILSLVITGIVVFLIFFFVTLFDTIFPPTSEKSISSKREKLQVCLYFSDINERFLVPEKRYIPKISDTEEQTKALVKALLEGSKTGCINTFPQNTEVQSVKIRPNDIALVSFNKDLIKFHPGGSASEMATIYSLTNTLITNIPKIKKVKLLVDGKEIESIKGHIDTLQSFSYNKEIIVPNAR
jgi:hypothetical protein